jgi:hypothetical protein
MGELHDGISYRQRILKYFIHKYIETIQNTAGNRTCLNDNVRCHTNILLNPAFGVYVHDQSHW